MTSSNSHSSHVYHIRLKGRLSPARASWFGEVTVLPQEDDETLLVGEFADQSALRGLLDQLWNLNFTILSIERVQ